MPFIWWTEYETFRCSDSQSCKMMETINRVEKAIQWVRGLTDKKWEEWTRGYLLVCSLNFDPFLKTCPWVRQCYRTTMLNKGLLFHGKQMQKMLNFTAYLYSLWWRPFWNLLVKKYIILNFHPWSFAFYQYVHFPSFLSPLLHQTFKIKLAE